MGAVQQRLTLRLESLYPLPPVTYDDLARAALRAISMGRALLRRAHSLHAGRPAIEALWEARTADAVKAGPKDSPRRARRN